MSWIEIGSINDIPRRGARCVATPAGKIAVFRTADDRVFAIDDRCPHKGGPLSQGIVHGAAVTCPLHNWVIALDTGKALGADEGAVRTYPVKVEGERLLIDASSLTSLAA
ncbi:nitrite reductase small subunit NirD [Chelatococcus sp. GCM10030263]|uniref:nitrite reductase small subunit NirD n=1 Tax=Chelatococcus sp. GCM10030263 TaxID=3273387 RepID=UPI00361DCC88